MADRTHNPGVLGGRSPPRGEERKGRRAKGATVDVFSYVEYRRYLRDWYTASKARAGMSFRAFSRRAKLGSPNYLKLVMDGHRNLSADMAPRFAHACGLEGNAADYFCALVRFNQAKAAPEKAEQYARLARFHRARNVRRLDLDRGAYHERWYLPAIRELAARSDFREDASWIAATLRPSIRQSEAADALATLERIGLLVRDAGGRLVQDEPLVTTGAEVRSVLVRTYHRAMLGLSLEAIDRFSPDERDVSSLTLCLDADGVARLKVRLAELRRELLELSAGERDPRQVVQLNIQLFPLSAPD